MPGINLQKEKEQSLVEALQQGKQEVLGLLYDAYAPEMLGVIYGIVQHDEVAEEVLQETFVAIWSRIGLYDASHSRFLIWGLAIARGIALEAVKSGKYDYLTKNGRKPDTSEKGKVKAMDPQLAPDDSRVISLAPQEKAILELIYMKGHSCSQTAAVLGITEAEVKTGLKKAFVHLRADKQA